MKFRYKYHTSQNEVLSGEISAPDRDAVYRILKGRGIKPSMVEAAPGLFNLLWGRGKRWAAIVVLVIVVCALVAVLFNMMGAARPWQEELQPLARCQIYGDPVVLENGLSTGWGNVFTNSADQLLAMYAQPGKSYAPIKKIPEGLVSAFSSALNTEVGYASDDPEEIRKLKCIVKWMKEEARGYVAAGGRIEGYIMRLQQRQQSEIDYYQSSKLMLENLYASDKAQAIELWSRRNDDLRARGISPIPLPSDDD